MSNSSELCASQTGGLECYRSLLLCRNTLLSLVRGIKLDAILEFLTFELDNRAVA